MIVRLDVPFADTSASRLRYLPSAPTLPVLAELDQPDLVPGGHLSLRLLGASHQAVLRLPDGEYAETLACLDLPEAGAPAAQPPPARRTVAVGAWQIRLRVTVDRDSPAVLAAASREMRDCAERADPDRSLYASFPGHPLAATFLRVRPRRDSLDSPAWTTVHVYPESGERVRTRTEIRPLPTTAGAGDRRPRRLREKV